MANIVVSSAETEDSSEECRIFRVTGTVDDSPFAVIVTPSSGEYDYEHYPAIWEQTDTDDEELQIAIGQHWADTNTEIGRVGR